MRTMASRRDLLRGLTAAGLAVMGGSLSRPAEAHRSHVSLTRVLGNTQAGTWEFSHALHLHDVIVALSLWLPGEDPNPAGDRARGRVALEVERRMRWTGPDGAALPLAMVGAELAGDELVVYQEIAAPTARGTYKVECTLLQDIFADQTNVILFGVSQPSQTSRLSAQSTRASFDRTR